MKDSFKVRGGNKLEGEVIANGSKNAGFPILAALVLLNCKIYLTNVPNIIDFKDFIGILELLGVSVEKVDNNSYFINPTTLNNTGVDYKLGSKIRGSYYLLGSILSKFRMASIPQPGGCNIGNRPMDLHLESLKKFGVKFTLKNGILNGIIDKVPEHSIEIELPFPSRGATINSILTSALLENVETTIINSDQSPESSSLIKFLSLAGLNIKRIGINIKIVGAKELELNYFSIAPDKIEIGTILVCGLVTNGEVKVSKIEPADLKQLEYILTQIGAEYSLSNNAISVLPNQLYKLKPSFLISGLYNPCIDADFEPIFTPLLCKVKGNSIIDDTINPERHSKFIPKLNSIGAKIIEVSPTRAIIEGNPLLNFINSKNLEANDIRGGVAQLIAALTAKGESILNNAVQIDRGYENIEKKLQILGGEVSRI